MDSINCESCQLPSPNIILNCGCLVCSYCFEVFQSFRESDETPKCILCNQEIILPMKIDINKKNISSQIIKYNNRQNNEKILYKLKVSYIIFKRKYFIIYSYWE